MAKFQPGHQLNITHGHAVGGHKTPEYRAWAHMLDRCYNPNNKSFHNYGGRGITICEKWCHSFSAFLRDVGPRPSPKHSIDRYPNKNGNYEPNNVRWATQKQQMNNMRLNVFVRFRGRKISLTDLAHRSVVSAKVIHTRIFYLGWSVERAITTPSQKPPFRGKPWIDEDISRTSWYRRRSSRVVS
jgi:hypothetical protein